MLEKKGDDFKLLVEGARGAAGTRRLNCQVEGRRAKLVQPAVGLGSQREQLTYRRHASRANRPMKRRCPTAVASVDLGGVLYEKGDDRDLRCGIPSTTGPGPWIALQNCLKDRFHRDLR
jgi:hypothetical protein